MKRTLFQTIIKESIQEGGNAVPSAQPVRGDLAGEIAKDVIQAVSRAFGCSAEPAGSTGKKGPEMTSGDIDILMDLPWSDENAQKMTEWVKQTYPTSEIVPSKGFKEISFGYPYTEGDEQKVAQVDLMFTSNINWRRWSAYSPSPYDEEYGEHGIEKAFKGLVQTVLLKAIASIKPLNIDELPKSLQGTDFSSIPFTDAEAQQIKTKRASRGREDADKLGRNKSYWRYMWDSEEGLMIVRKSFEGARGMLIDPKIQERLGPVTNNVDEGLKLIMGPAATTEVLKNPITLVKYLFSGNYPYGTPENLRRIHNVVVNNDQIKEMPGVVENFEKVWNTYANAEKEPQGEPAYSSSISERLETLKLSLNDVRRIAKSLIKENVNNELNAFHGTSANFDRFDPNFMGSGEGAQMYGWGIYVTTNQQTGEHYADVAAGTNGKNEKYLYTVNIPDDNGKNYLNIEGNPPETYDAIASGLMKLRPDAKDNIEYCLNYCKENNTLMWLFQSQCDYAFSLKELSELLNKIGYDGVKVPVKYREAGLGEEGYNYTIFDTNKVKIVNKNRL